MESKLTVAAISPETKPGSTDDNLEAIRRSARQAAGRGARLAICPELSLTGFLPNHPRGDHAQWLSQALSCAWKTAETLDGRAVRALAAIASEAGLYLAAGMLENAGNVLCNTYVLVDGGGLRAHWRKMHVPVFEMQLYNGGDAPLVVDTSLGRIGANICFDALLPESTRLLGVQNCEIALFPFAADPAPGSAEAWAAWARPVLQARCAENGVFGIACNYAGRVECAGAEQEFPGGALIVGPNGAVIADSSERLLLATLEGRALTEARAAFEYTFRFRRPELYRPLAR